MATQQQFVYNSTTQYVGFFNSNPTASLDITGNGKISGNLEVGGNLTVTGTTLAFDVSNFSIEGKNLELAIPSDSTLPTDAAIDQGGIILSSQTGSKDILWRNATSAWTFNQNIDLAATDTIGNLHLAKS